MAGKLIGTVVAVKDSGDLVTDITAQQLEGVPRDERVSITCDGHFTTGIFTPEHRQPELTFLAMVGEDDRLELSMVGESASAFLGIRAGYPVIVAW